MDEQLKIEDLKIGDRVEYIGHGNAGMWREAVVVNRSRRLTDRVVVDVTIRDSREDTYSVSSITIAEGRLRRLIEKPVPIVATTETIDAVASAARDGLRVKELEAEIARLQSVLVEEHRLVKAWEDRASASVRTAEKFEDELNNVRRERDQLKLSLADAESRREELRAAGREIVKERDEARRERDDARRALDNIKVYPHREWYEALCKTLGVEAGYGSQGRVFNAIDELKKVTALPIVSHVDVCSDSVHRDAFVTDLGRSLPHDVRMSSSTLWSLCQRVNALKEQTAAQLAAGQELDKTLEFEKFQHLQTVKERDRYKKERDEFENGMCEAQSLLAGFEQHFADCVIESMDVSGNGYRDDMLMTLKLRRPRRAYGCISDQAVLKIVLCGEWQRTFAQWFGPSQETVKKLEAAIAELKR